MTPPIPTAASTASHPLDSQPLPKAFFETLAMIKKSMNEEHEKAPVNSQSDRLVPLSLEDWKNISDRAKSTRLECDKLIVAIQDHKPRRNLKESVATSRT